MNFDGEHLLPGQAGHFFVILAFVSSIIATISYFSASRHNPGEIKSSWIKLARLAFAVQVLSVIVIFAIIFFICSHHYFEYMYVYKHASKELEYKYLLACIWEGQEGSFLLWTIWHSVLGIIFIFKGREWEEPVMSVVCFAQFFLLMMILGIYFFDVRIGNSPFTLTRNEINAPIFSQPDYLNFVKDGMGLNVLLRNYWMVIHPPVLFLGFASTLIPFAFAYAGIQTKRFGEWIIPALPWVLFSALVLGTGIMMGGKWAYESLSFGGYWAWDPVENASLVPWLILIAGLHTMVVFKATGHALRASYLFAILTFVFILYSTFLTRTGVLGDTSVHAFTEAGSAINIMIGTFVLAFTLPILVMFFSNYKNIPAIHKEEDTSSREFWMFMGSLVLFLSALFIIAITSIPVYNKMPLVKDIILKFHGGPLALPPDPEFLYNKVMVLVAIIIGLLTAFSQYFKFKSTPASSIIKKMAAPTLVAALITTAIAVVYPLAYHKQGMGFLLAIYTALFATVYSVIANAMYIWVGVKGRFRSMGPSVAHVGFALMLAGILISSSNKEVISNSNVNGINLAAGTDPLTRQQDDPRENLTLIRQLPTRMATYQVTYQNDSSGNEKGRKFYSLLFERKDPATTKTIETFTLKPDVYLMKDNSMSSNPDTKSYLSKDVFTYVSFAMNKANNEDTAQFTIKEMNEGDTGFYSNGFFILNKVLRNPHDNKFHFKETDAALVADITVTNKEGMKFHAYPYLQVDSFGIYQTDDTLYAQNMYFRFAGITNDSKIKIGIKESDKLLDFVTVKTYVFPYINLVWLGLIIMAAGIVISFIKRAKLNQWQGILALLGVATALFYMFLLAN